MRILIDTNIVLNYLGINNIGQKEAKTIFNLALEKTDVIELVSSSAITDIYYVIKSRGNSRETTREHMADFRKYIHILPVTEADIDKAYDRDWKDFEDAVQYTVAESNNVDYIITNNTKDFEENDIPIYTPAGFIKEIIPTIP